MILSLEPWQDEVLEEALKHDFIFADDTINLKTNTTIQFPKNTFDKPRKVNHQCAICSYLFRNQIALDKHVARFHKGKSVENKKILRMNSNKIKKGFQCPICLDFFRSEYYVAKHISNVHEGRKLEVYKNDKKCPICVTVFQTQNDFKRHISSVHRCSWWKSI